MCVCVCVCACARAYTYTSVQGITFQKFYSSISMATITYQLHFQEYLGALFDPLQYLLTAFILRIDTRMPRHRDAIPTNSFHS